jgi:hypothetical protein
MPLPSSMLHWRNFIRQDFSCSWVTLYSLDSGTPLQLPNRNERPASGSGSGVSSINGSKLLLNLQVLEKNLLSIKFFDQNW